MADLLPVFISTAVTQQTMTAPILYAPQMPHKSTVLYSLGLILTNKRSRYVHLWIVVEGLEVMFVGHLDVPHPVEQILCPRVVHRKHDELTSHRHVC